MFKASENNPKLYFDSNVQCLVFVIYEIDLIIVEGVKQAVKGEE